MGQILNCKSIKNRKMEDYLQASLFLLLLKENSKISLFPDFSEKGLQERSEGFNQPQGIS